MLKYARPFFTHSFLMQFFVSSSLKKFVNNNVFQFCNDEMEFLINDKNWICSTVWKLNSFRQVHGIWPTAMCILVNGKCDIERDNKAAQFHWHLKIAKQYFLFSKATEFIIHLAFIKLFHSFHLSQATVLQFSQSVIRFSSLNDIFSFELMLFAFVMKKTGTVASQLNSIWFQFASNICHINAQSGFYFALCFNKKNTHTHISIARKRLIHLCFNVNFIAVKHKTNRIFQ